MVAVTSTLSCSTPTTHARHRARHRTTLPPRAGCGTTCTNTCDHWHLHGISAAATATAVDAGQMGLSARSELPARWFAIGRTQGRTARQHAALPGRQRRPKGSPYARLASMRFQGVASPQGAASTTRKPWGSATPRRLRRIILNAQDEESASNLPRISLSPNRHGLQPLLRAGHHRLLLLLHAARFPPAQHKTGTRLALQLSACMGVHARGTARGNALCGVSPPLVAVFY